MTENRHFNYSADNQYLISVGIAIQLTCKEFQSVIMRYGNGGKDSGWSIGVGCLPIALLFQGLFLFS